MLRARSPGIAAPSSAASAGERVIVMGHYPVYPANIHNMWASQRIVDLLSAHDNVVGYFCGHNHAGNYGRLAGKHFVNFRGMVDTPTTTAYSAIDVHNDRIKIRGTGHEENRTLALGLKA